VSNNLVTFGSQLGEAGGGAQSNKTIRHSGFTTTVLESTGWVGLPIGATSYRNGTVGFHDIHVISGLYNTVLLVSPVISSNVVGSIHINESWQYFNAVTVMGNGDLVVQSAGAKILRHEGFSSTYIDSFNDVGSDDAGAIAYDVGNDYLISGRYSPAKTTRFSGFSSTVIDSVTTWFNKLGWDKTNTDLIGTYTSYECHRYTGFSATIETSFNWSSFYAYSLHGMFMDDAYETNTTATWGAANFQCVSSFKATPDLGFTESMGDLVTSYTSGASYRWYRFTDTIKDSIHYELDSTLKRHDAADFIEGDYVVESSEHTDRLSGFTTTLVDSLTHSYSGWTAEVTDGDLYRKSSTSYTEKYIGFTSTFDNSVSATGIDVQFTPEGWYSGFNLLAVDNATSPDKIRMHDGFTATILDSYSLDTSYVDAGTLVCSDRSDGLMFIVAQMNGAAGGNVEMLVYPEFAAGSNLDDIIWEGSHWQQALSFTLTSNNSIFCKMESVASVVMYTGSAATLTGVATMSAIPTNIAPLGQVVGSSNITPHYKLDYLSGTIRDSYSLGLGDRGRLTASDQSHNVYNNYGEYSRKHDGFSSTFLDSFSIAATDDLYQATWDGTNILHSVYEVGPTYKFYKHSGYSSTISDSFTQPTSATLGSASVEWDAGDFWAFYGSVGAYQFTGFTSTVRNSSTIMGGETVTSHFKWHGIETYLGGAYGVWYQLNIDGDVIHTQSSGGLTNIWYGAEYERWDYDQVHGRLNFNVEATQGGSTSIDVPVPQATVDGDILIAVLVSDGANETHGATDGGWTNIFTNEISDGSSTMQVWWRAAGASEPGTYNFTCGSAEPLLGYIINVNGCDTTAPIDNYGSNTGSSAAPQCPTITPNWVAARPITGWALSRSQMLAPAPARVVSPSPCSPGQLRPQALPTSR
jgi:hypothetical protein